MQLLDGLYSLYNSLINSKNSLNTNRNASVIVGREEIEALYKNGLLSKIIRLKIGYALNDTIQFESEKEKEIYNSKLDAKVKKAALFMLAFGRGVILLFNEGDNLSEPLREKEDYQIAPFGSEIITATNPSYDITHPRYMKPQVYMIKTQINIHWSRIIDFTYIEPIDREKGAYHYGGIGELEMVRSQSINDSIIERSIGTIIEKNARWVYKIKGLRDELRSKQEKPIFDYLSKLESMSGLYGASVLDDEDTVEAISQSITNLNDVDQITLRRLAAVTGIPLSALVGENVKGLNSNGANEQEILDRTIKNLQSDYLIDPIKKLCSKFGIENIKFKESQTEKALEKAQREQILINNAKALSEMQEDSSKYLEEAGIIEADEHSIWDDKD